ncbi:radical SAM protein [Methanosarcina sp. KYL-1]|uniref:radical SAM protein n=1 Tax=Methanosarcina sp. KYL-1 TaxID=2602068 RepID=UPI002100AC35|nr:radical SAM protein [Methanosarcina sp. KYL-1]MCQ1537135.1 radical SAM protein [Methanosarcina sp. KYL-1]
MKNGYETSLDLIEIDVTFKCNLMCYNCDRSCRQAPEERHMSTEQIGKFLEETQKKNRSWKRIRILGGEPYLHPEIHEIMRMLAEYKSENRDTVVEIVTNGYGPEVNKAIKNTPTDIIIKNTKKVSQYNKKFEPFNIAPVDKKEYLSSDYTKACWITEECGMGLNPYGYYQCGVAGSIDRVFGFDIGLKKMPDEQQQLTPLKKKLCAYCGHFLNQKFIPPEARKPLIGEPQTRSWKMAYSNYKKQKPSMTVYL